MSTVIKTISGQCHCGNVCVINARAPDYLNDCNCSLCRRLGALWAYYPSSEVEISGETIGYVREDLSEPAVAVHHCPKCGTATHWIPLSEAPYDRMAVNARLFDETAIDGVEIKYPDGRSWER